MIHVLPTLWCRNIWSWGNTTESCDTKPRISKTGPTTISVEHGSLGQFTLEAEPISDGAGPALLFTENETNVAHLFDAANYSPYVKDAFHGFVVNGRPESVNPANIGTKAAAYYALDMPAGSETVLRLRLSSKEEAPADPFGAAFNKIFASRIKEADAFYEQFLPATIDAERRQIARQAFAGLFWSKQFYYYVVKDWLKGDADQPIPPKARKRGRNAD